MVKGSAKLVFDIKFMTQKWCKCARAGKRIFSDLVTINAPQDSGITITNMNWHIVVDPGYNELEFYSTKSDFVEPTCKKN